METPMSKTEITRPYSDPIREWEAQMAERSKYYRATDAECRCLVCGSLLALPAFWFDVLPPDRNCPEGAKVVTDCKQQMEDAKARAWMLKECTR